MTAQKDITIVVVGTLDTKGPEVGFLKEKITSRGCTPIVIDAGVLGKPEIKPDISRGELAP